MPNPQLKGWSVSSVDGVWFSKRKRPVEEATQIVRIIFRFKSSFMKESARAGCADVLRSIIFWVIGQQGRIAEHKVWSRDEQERFLERHRTLMPHKELFARKKFIPIAREAGKWMDNCVLFVFGYLVRKFWENVVAEKLYEEEIWITSLFNLTLNVVKKGQP